MPAEPKETARHEVKAPVAQLSALEDPLLAVRLGLAQDEEQQGPGAVHVERRQEGGRRRVSEIAVHVVQGEDHKHEQKVLKTCDEKEVEKAEARGRHFPLDFDPAVVVVLFAVVNAF